MGQEHRSRWLRRKGLLLVFTLVPSLLSMSTRAAAAEVWTGQWKVTVVVESGSNAGSTLVCDGEFEQDGVTFGGTVTCPGYSPVTIYGEGANRPTGLLPNGGHFSGARSADTASGTWALPNQGSSGRWSLTRGGAP